MKIKIQHQYNYENIPIVKRIENVSLKHHHPPMGWLDSHGQFAFLVGLYFEHKMHR
jgi:hypothetical protein